MHCFCILFAMNRVKTKIEIFEDYQTYHISYKRELYDMTEYINT